MNAKLLLKVIMKIINHIQLLSINTKITYSKFKSLVKLYLISLLTNLNFYDNEK